ncbi:NAD(P)-dependent oxidoreductase [Rhodopila sp.]|jgi:D-3-phosphoglycerate dehydrogenase|uniref:NAD(P)-dependent oxidoreductase n=1 Tax=Rhodopila sp. TaxID=2480087 RepID=UPI002C8D9DDF|nr:NAD(P)-dependent oxidoreductase [Rhodopila sp.]HVZ10400.1 NAD(P)-dependent oxidoreductase [Rhodopila sp.]
MAINRKRLAFFERWFDPVAEQILGAQDDIELVRLSYDAAAADNWAELATSCGYQIGARTELREPWFGDAALLARCPTLLAISSTGAGYDVIDVDACNAAGVIVVNQSGTNSEPVAEHAIALMLGLTKRVGFSHRAMLKGTAHDRLQLSGNNIRGKTVGIVGIGQIGRLTARYCAAFDMTVLACDPYLTAAQVAERGARKVDFPTLLRESDFITVHCPRNAETLGMFDAAAFARMKPNAYFINTARGKIHDEGALIEALTAGRIAGAGIDVFDVEPPPPDHPLLHMDTVMATPHIAGGTVETHYDMAKATAEQWIALLRGRVPPRLVNPEIWPAYADRFERIIGFRPDPLPGA